MKYTELTDTELWTYFKNGDDCAISYIYSEYAEILYRYGLKFTSHITLVEDALQELFVDIIKNRKSISNTDNILFYLLKSYKRKILRKIQSEKRFVGPEEIQEYQFEVTWSVEQKIISDEISEQKSKMLLKALNELTPRQKEAVYLRFTRELSYKDIANIMEVSVEVCRNYISKAISILKQQIDEKGGSSVLLFLMLLK